MAQLPLNPFLPQELKDKIIGLLDDRTEDLRACALSSRSLLYAAQALLFQKISVSHPRNDTDDPPMEAEDCAFAGAAFGRLAEVLIESPHLIPHIRSMSVTTYLEVVLLLAEMELTHLRNLTLYSDLSGAIDGPLVAPLRRVIARSSIRRVTICAAFSAHIFGACTPYLTELEFDAAEEDSGSDGTTPVFGAVRPEVNHLILRNSPSTSEWLANAACPFDVSHLVYVAVLASMSSGVRKLLGSAKQTISTLELTACALLLLCGDLDLIQYSRSRTGTSRPRTILRVEANLSFVPHICHIVCLLPSILDLDRMNVIQTITFNLEDAFCDHQWTTAAEDKLVRFDAALARLPLTALKDVIVLLPELDCFGDYRVSEVILNRSLPLLSMRQVLRVGVNA
ncbi:hypothetical protein FB451DRAFT_1230552 [Mycena latifolia]|nr:hypothetical protein FB451DRAFT_1230552 [Mycena latifolia]